MENNSAFIRFGFVWGWRAVVNYKNERGGLRSSGRISAFEHLALLSG